MQIRPEEITQILKSQLANFEKKLDVSEADAAGVPVTRFVSSWRALALFVLAFVAVVLIVKRPF